MRACLTCLAWAGMLVMVAAAGCAPAQTLDPEARLSLHTGAHELVLAPGESGRVTSTGIYGYVRFGSPLGTDAPQRFVSTEPASALRRVSRAVPELGIYVDLALPEDQPVTVRVRAGLPLRDGPLATDHVWTVRAVPPTRVRMRAGGRDALVYRDRRMAPATGPTRAEDVLVLRDPPAELALSFDRPVDAASITAALEYSLQNQARLEVEWPRPDLARLRLDWEPPEPGTWHEILFSSDGCCPPMDSRGLPVQFELPAVELHPRTRFMRWRPAEGSRPGGAVPPRVTAFEHDGTVSDGRALMQHFEEVAGDYLLHTPVLVDTASGVMQRLQVDAGIDEARWLPDGRGIVLPGNNLRLFDADGALARTVELGSGDGILDLAVDPSSGKIAVFVLHDTAGPLGRVQLDLHAPDGERLVSIPDVSATRHLELSYESPDPAWLPDGRLAFLRLEPGDDRPPPRLRELVIIDPASAQMQHTGVRAGRILGAGPGGIVLLPPLDSEEQGPPVRYDPARGEAETLVLPAGRSIDLTAVSPDGAWVAGIEYAGDTMQVGAFHIANRTWHTAGHGTLVGWDKDGSLVWMQHSDD